jgi:succinate-acetate transporter protein
MFGVISMVSSVAAEGLRLVLMQYVLSRKQMQPLEALQYVAPACFVWLSLAVIMFESKAIMQKQAWHIVVDNPSYFVFSACVGFALNGLAMAVIKLASALALKVLGVCKDIGLVAVSVAAYSEKVSLVQIMGYCVSLLGFGWYNRIKSRPSPIK